MYPAHGEFMFCNGVLGKFIVLEVICQVYGHVWHYCKGDLLLTHKFKASMTARKLIK